MSPGRKHQIMHATKLLSRMIKIPSVALLHHLLRVVEWPGFDESSLIRNLRLSESLKKNQLWNGIISITLLEGKNVSGGSMTEMFVQLKLGDQRYKSKTLCKSANPQWQEQFDFHYFSDRMGILDIEVWGKDSKKHEERLGTVTEIAQVLLSISDVVTTVIYRDRANTDVQKITKRAVTIIKDMVGGTSMDGRVVQKDPPFLAVLLKWDQSTALHAPFVRKKPTWGNPMELCKVDISALPLKQANCLELPLDSCLGALLMLVTLTPCAGVSVSDLCVCPLADPSERKQITQRYDFLGSSESLLMPCKAIALGGHEGLLI
ncbi:Multiple C2 and transmembrane domain-containing protein 2 [Saguinus oedipus]|uniref:Multiple C2 and transmembrane domain-containing protein 2 n=1 Tax=Saguinus oedipus TaxID=9490 RepID=A0ABQ9VE64_SAGOE|nr:Multiple C2 and transmembrane domain-containing protein 2 [Saguinus oedipus]